MGTYKDWILVALVTIFWGVYKPVLRAITGRKLLDSGFWASMDAVPLTFFGFFTGIMIAFHWAAFRWPIVVVTLAAFIAALIAMSAKKRTHPVS
jgi:hypothetical protein